MRCLRRIRLCPTQATRTNHKEKERSGRLPRFVYESVFAFRSCSRPGSPPNRCLWRRRPLWSTRLRCRANPTGSPVDRYAVANRSVEPAPLPKLTDSWISLNIRFIAIARERKVKQSRIYRKLRKEARASGDIKMVPERLDITHLLEGAGILRAGGA